MAWRLAALFVAIACLIGVDGVVPRAQGVGGNAPASAQAEQTPTFRVGTDLLTVDVSVVDSSGRPIEGLTPADFTIKIDGKVRKIANVELAKPNVDQTAGVGRDPSKLTTSVLAGRPRHLLFVVDQLYIPTGSIKPLMESATRFLDRLAPVDQAGYIAFPQGAHVDFTTDRSKVRDAMTGMVGMPSIDRLGKMAIGVAQARIVADKERYQVDTTSLPAVPPDDRTPIFRDLFDRNCSRDALVPENQTRVCVMDLLSQSAEIAQRSKTDAMVSVKTLESIVNQLGAVEGSKSLILISASMAITEQRDLDELKRLAALTRTSFNVLIVDPVEESQNIGLYEPNAKKMFDVNSANEDRRIRFEGLEEVAANGRGAVYRIAGNGDGVFQRLATELSASYVLGLESIQEDLSKGPRKVEVSVKRPGARIRTAQAYVNTASAATLATAAPASRPADAIIRDALAATTERSDVPLRVATYTRWDTDSDKLRVNLTANIGAPGANADDFTVGYVVVDKDNKTVASAAQRPLRAEGNAAPPFGALLMLPPGVYSLRMNVVDAKGKRSTAIRQLNVSRATTDDLATSDLVIGDAPGQGQGLTPSADPRVTSGKLAAYVEIYSDNLTDLDWTFVHVDIAKDEKGEALASEEITVGNGPRPSWRVATGVVSVDGLAPGTYVARARVVRDDKTLRVLTRPFVIEATESTGRR